MTNKRLKIILFGDPALRQKAKPVIVFHHKLHNIIDSMATTLDNRDDGAALAANQIGILKRIVVINYEDEYLELINPEIISSSGKQTKYEGCLSYPGYVGLVSRSETVKVKYFDRNGIENVIEKSGNFAICLQHEIDHLDGILFIDKVEEKHIVHSDTKMKVDLDEVLDISNGKLAARQADTSNQ